MKREPERLVRLQPALAEAAQKVYDEWAQDEDGIDEALGAGGICQDIADAMAGVLTDAGVDCYTQGAEIGEQHVLGDGSHRRRR